MHVEHVHAAHPRARRERGLHPQALRVVVRDHLRARVGGGGGDGAQVGRAGAEVPQARVPGAGGVGYWRERYGQGGRGGGGGRRH